MLGARNRIGIRRARKDCSQKASWTRICFAGEARHCHRRRKSSQMPRSRPPQPIFDPDALVQIPSTSRPPQPPQPPQEPQALSESEEPSVLLGLCRKYEYNQSGIWAIAVGRHTVVSMFTLSKEWQSRPAYDTIQWAQDVLHHDSKFNYFTSKAIDNEAIRRAKEADDYNRPWHAGHMLKLALSCSTNSTRVLPLGRLLAMGVKSLGSLDVRDEIDATSFTCAAHFEPSYTRRLYLDPDRLFTMLGEVDEDARSLFPLQSTQRIVFLDVRDDLSNPCVRETCREEVY